MYLFVAGMRGGPPFGRDLDFLTGGQDAVGYGGGFYGGADVVRADNVCAGEDGSYVGGGGGVETVFHVGWGSVQVDGQRRILRQGVSEEALAGGSDEKGLVELAELVEVGEERVVFVEAFAETEAGIEDDFVARDAGGENGVEADG